MTVETVAGAHTQPATVPIACAEPFVPRDVLLGCAPLSLEKRATFQEATKACARELFREAGGHQRVAELFAISTARAYNFTNRNNSEQISFWRVAAATSPAATSAARYLATLAGGVFVPLPSVEDAEPMAHLAESARSHGQAIAEAVKALADHRVTPAEARVVVREIDCAIRDLAALRGSVVTVSEVPRK